MERLDVQQVRKDFPMCCGVKMNGYPLVYFDNAATTLKPKKVIDAVVDFYTKETTNVERGDSAISAAVSVQYENARKTVGKFLNADPSCCVFTSGATGALNMVAMGYGEKFLKEGDVILTSLEEHAADILPWFRVAERTGAKIRYVDLEKDGRITPENVRKAMDGHVKLVALAGVSNVMGYVVPVKEIASIAHQYGALAAIDGAQLVPHVKTDVQDLDVDFLSFSAHKCCGPSGVGVLYGKKELLEEMDAPLLGGGSNARFSSDGTLILRDVPDKFEAGTQPIEGVLGMGAALEYLMGLGMERIGAYEEDLRKYLISRMKELDNIELVNPDAETGIVTFNVRGVFPQDAGGYLSSRGIAVRSGLHCAKMMPEFLGVPGTVRASLYFYNTKEECDRFTEALKDCTVENAVGTFF